MPALLRRGMLITVATLFSRPLGYVRVAIQAWIFGATAAMDAFVLAFSVPSMLQVILLTGPLRGCKKLTSRFEVNPLSMLDTKVYNAVAYPNRVA